MNDESLGEYLASHHYQGPFQPHAQYVGPWVNYYWKAARCFTVRVDKNLDLFLSLDGKELIGFRVHGLPTPDDTSPSG
jgi:hypothetical protein